MSKETGNRHAASRIGGLREGVTQKVNEKKRGTEKVWSLSRGPKKLSPKIPNYYEERGRDRFCHTDPKKAL